MDGYRRTGRADRSFGILFGEDFDVRETPPEPVVVEPVVSAAALTDAREAAWREGHVAGQREAAEAEAAATRLALEAIAGVLADTRHEAVLQADGAADAIAHLLLDCLAASFPALCARYGDAEVQALVAAVLPSLSQEPAITVHANSRTVRAVRLAVARLDPDLSARVELIDHDDMTQGDVRVSWRNGRSVRNAAELWQQVVEILVPAGLLRQPISTKEPAYVD